MPSIIRQVSGVLLFCLALRRCLEFVGALALASGGLVSDNLFCFVGYFKSLGGRVCFPLAYFFRFSFLATYRMQSWTYSTRILDPRFLLTPHPQSGIFFKMSSLWFLFHFWEVALIFRFTVVLYRVS